MVGDSKFSAVFLAFVYKYTIRSTVSDSDSLSDSKSETRVCVQNVTQFLFSEYT